MMTVTMTDGPPAFHDGWPESGEGPSTEEREARLATGADRLVGVRRSILAHPQLLLIVAATLMTSGLVVIVLGWIGASHAILVEEQVPYVISGGILGLALATIGAVTLFAHWLTVMIREARQREADRRQDHLELLGAIAALTAAVKPPSSRRS